MALRKIVSTYAASLISIVTSLLSNVWLLGIVTREVDKPTLGLFLFLNVNANLLGLLQLSLDFAAGQRIAVALAESNAVRAVRLYTQTARINQWLAVIIGVFTVGGVIGVNLGLMATERPGVIATVVALMGTNQIILCLARPVIAGLTGAQHLTTIQILRILGSILNIAFTYIFLITDFGIVSLALAEVCAQIVVWQILTSRLRRYCTWATLKVENPYDGLGELLRYGFTVSIASMINFASMNLEPFLLRRTDFPDQFLAEYYIWARFPMLFATLTMSLFAAASPPVTAAFAEHVAKGFTLFRKVSVLYVLVTVCGAIGLGTWLTPVVHHWTRGQYDQSDGPLLALSMSAWITFRSILMCGFLFCYATNNLRLVSLAYTVIFSLKLIVGIVLVTLLPLPGLAFADAIGSVFACILIASQLVRMAVISVTETVITAGVLVAGLAMSAVMGPLVAKSDLIGTILGIGGTTAVFALVIGTAGLLVRRSRSANERVRTNQRATVSHLPPMTVDPDSDSEQSRSSFM